MDYAVSSASLASSHSASAASSFACTSARRFDRSPIDSLANRGSAFAGSLIARSIAVYAADPLPIDAHGVEALNESVALLHSARAARRLGEVIGDARASVRIAAISPAVIAAAGPGWAEVAAASAPNDTALVELARRLAD